MKFYHVTIKEIFWTNTWSCYKLDWNTKLWIKWFVVCHIIIICILLMHEKHYSVTIGSICFFSSFEIKKIPSFSSMPGYKRSFFILVISTCFTFFKFKIPSQKLDMNNNFKIICILINIIKVNNIKAYTKNTHFITRKYGITRNFDKIEYTIIYM